MNVADFSFWRSVLQKIVKAVKKFHCILEKDQLGVTFCYNFVILITFYVVLGGCNVIVVGDPVGAAGYVE